jgi:hypothetical protein
VGLVQNGAKSAPAVPAFGEQPFPGVSVVASAALVATHIVSKMTVPASALHARTGRRQQPCVIQDTTANFRPWLTGCAVV